MYGGYGSTSPPLTNNPFLPNTGSQTGSRFPDISSPNGFGTGQSWGDGSLGAGGGGYTQQGYQQYPQNTQTGYGAPQPQMGMGMNGGGMGFMQQQSYPSPTTQSPPPAPFQPSSSFGQQLQAANMSGSSYGYLNGQPQQQQDYAYNPAQQQLQNNPNYVAQLDPYSALGQMLDAPTNANQPALQNGYGQQNGYNNPAGIAQSFSTGSTASSSGYSSSSSGSASGGNSFGLGPSGNQHPKDYIRSHKGEIEAWDNYAWKQFLGSFEAMKHAWEGRKTELTAKARELISQGQMGMAYGGYYAQQIQQEAARLQGLLKEAESNFDTVTASTFQMQEVFGGYRQSGDMASKRRVREATNAALQALPGWPQPY